MREIRPSGVTRGKECCSFPTLHSYFENLGSARRIVSADLSIRVIRSQPIMPCFLPVQVRSREVAVCPRSYTQHGCGVIQTRESLSVIALVGEGRASLRAVALSEPCSLVTRPTPGPTCVGHVDAEPVRKRRRPERMVKHSQRQPSGPSGYGGRHEGTETGSKLGNLSFSARGRPLGWRSHPRMHKWVEENESLG